VWAAVLQRHYLQHLRPRPLCWLAAWRQWWPLGQLQGDLDSCAHGTSRLRLLLALRPLVPLPRRRKQLARTHLGLLPLDVWQH